MKMTLQLRGPKDSEQGTSSSENIVNERRRYEELADPKYTDVGGIFDIMVTVIEQHLAATA